MRIVQTDLHVLLRNRLPVAGPSCAGFEFCLRIEKGCRATDTVINAVVVILGVLSRECTLGSLPPRDFELLGRKLFAPLVICFLNFFDFPYARLAACCVEVRDTDRVSRRQPRHETGTAENYESS